MQKEFEEVASLLDFASKRAKNGQMTLEEAQSCLELLLERTTLWASVKELAAYYDQSEHNVRCVINRRYLGKPKRKVYYSFNQFRKIVPKSWKCRKNDADNQGYD